MMLLQPLPILRLRREHEIHHIARNETQPTVILLWFPPAIPARHRLAVRGQFLLGSIGIPRTSIRPKRQQAAFDRGLETALGDFDGHTTSSRTSILPVTAAEMIAERNSLSCLMASRTFPTRASIRERFW